MEAQDNIDDGDDGEVITMMMVLRKEKQELSQRITPSHMHTHDARKARDEGNERASPKTDTQYCRRSSVRRHQPPCRAKPKKMNTHTLQNAILCSFTKVMVKSELMARRYLYPKDLEDTNVMKKNETKK